MISKIPVLGDLVIPKEVGEGLFGISFKMKGPKGNIKTSINPIRTLTPRFIQKIIDKKIKQIWQIFKNQIIGKIAYPCHFQEI